MIVDPLVNVDPIEANLIIQAPVEMNVEDPGNRPASPPADIPDSGVPNQPHEGEQSPVVQEARGDEPAD